MLWSSPYKPSILLALSLSILVGCESSPTEPEPDPGATMTVDATSTESWVLVDLGSPATIVQAADPATSGAWDIAFRTSSVMVNGGAGGAVAYCVCQNASATPEQVMAMTAAGEHADFEAVTRADIPPGTLGWSATAIADDPWYGYNLTGDDHQIWPTYNVYLVKRGSEVYKVQITSYYRPTGEPAPRHITFRYARLAE